MKVRALMLMAVLVSPAHPQEPSPQPEMQRLARILVGSWRTREKYEPGEIAPHGGFGTGTATVRLGPGGRSLISDYTAVDPSGNFVSHGIMWWDRKVQAYRGVECYNRSAGGCEIGLWHWEGTDLVSHGEGFREVFTQFTPTAHTFYMEDSAAGGVMTRSMTITFTRIEEPSTPIKEPRP